MTARQWGHTPTKSQPWGHRRHGKLKGPRHIFRGVARLWGHPPTERRGGPPYIWGGERGTWGHPPHQRSDGDKRQRSAMGTHPPLKVSHGNIPPTKGQAWGHPPTQRQGGPTIHLGGQARYMGTSSPLNVRNGDIPHQRPKARHKDISPTKGQPWGHSPPNHQPWGHTSGIGTYPPPKVRYGDITPTKGNGHGEITPIKGQPMGAWGHGGNGDIPYQRSAMGVWGHGEGSARGHRPPSSWGVPGDGGWAMGNHGGSRLDVWWGGIPI